VQADRGKEKTGEKGREEGKGDELRLLSVIFPEKEFLPSLLMALRKGRKRGKEIGKKKKTKRKGFALRLRRRGIPFSSGGT